MAIDGIISGLDTSTIIEQLMNAERVPVDLMTARKTKAQSAVDAYEGVKSKLAAISTASSALERSSGWNIRSGTSSNSALATVTAGAGATIGSLQFTVDKLATTHGVATSTNSLAATSIIASGGTIALTVGATPHNISVGSGSMNEVATAINDANVGVRAAVVNTGSGYRLQLTAGAGGAAAAFTISGLDVATGVTTQGINAELTFGTGAGAYTISSSTNTFTNVLAGVNVTAKSTGTEVVTATVGTDVDGLADKVKTLVDAVNSALTEIKTRTAYDPSSKAAASLAGDATARRAAQALTRAVSDAVSQSALGSPGLAGVALDRNGKVTFDRDKFTTAYAADPGAVERLFVQGGNSTGDVQFVSAGARAAAGPREVIVTLAAAQANEVGLVGAFPTTVPATIRVRVGSAVVIYPVQAGESDSDTVNGLQAALTSAGFPLEVSASGGGISVRTSAYGSAAKFDVDWGTGSFNTVSGTDAAGTIDGIAAVGTGRQLSVPATDGTLSGLSVLLTSNATGSVGTVNYEPGLAQRLSSAVAAATDASTGYVTSARASRQNRIDLLSTSIDSYEIRLTAREKRLRSDFAKLEVVLGRLKEQSSMLGAQLGSASASS